MVFPEDLSLDLSYDVLHLNVISSNTITSRTSLLVKHLTQEVAGEKPTIACLRAKASVANKLISAIEIAKRELSQGNKKVYQYSTITSEVVSVKTNPSHALRGRQPSKSNVGDEEGVVEEDEDVAFEMMKQKDKVRDVPVLTIYLSMEPIKGLRDAHGEQAD